MMGAKPSSIVHMGLVMLRNPEESVRFKVAYIINDRRKPNSIIRMALVITYTMFTISPSMYM